MRFEFLQFQGTVTLDGFQIRNEAGRHEDATALLNRYGQAGWDLANISPLQRTNDSIVLLKRAVD